MENKEVVETMEQENWSPLDLMLGLYGNLKGLENYDNYYDSQSDNKNLRDLNNNPKIPTVTRLKDALMKYKESAELLQDYSEFMNAFDNLYGKVIDTKLNLLAFNINAYVDPTCVKDPSELNEKKFKEDYKRIQKFISNGNWFEDFRNASKNMLINGEYFCWLRDSYGTFNEKEIDVSEDSYRVKRTQDFCIQMMPQKYCRISGRFPKGFLWDFDLNYFDDFQKNPMDYDPSLISLYNERQKILKTKEIKSFANGKSDIDKTAYSTDGYVRTGVNYGAWCFKYDTSNFNSMPPYASLMKDALDMESVKKWQNDKDMLSSLAIILGEMKTWKNEDKGGNKNPFVIDPKKVGGLLQVARKMVNNSAIKQISLPLEETRLYQFQDGNSKMLDNRLKATASQAISAGSMIYTDQKLSLAELENALTIDYNSIAQCVYPQLMNFLNFYGNKKTKKYKFKFKVEGSTLPFLRKKDMDNQKILSDMGMQASAMKFSTLAGYDPLELEGMMMQAKYDKDNIQEKLFLMMNSNTNSDKADVGNPTKDTSDLGEGGAISRDYE